MKRDEMAALLRLAASVMAELIHLCEGEAGSERATDCCARMAEACREAAALLGAAEGGNRE